MLRLGILLDSYKIPAWIYHSLERIVNSDFADFSLVITNGKPDDQSTNERFLKDKKRIVYQVFNKIDEKIFKRGQDALEIVDAEKLFYDVPVINIEPVIKDAANYIEPKWINEIRRYRLDLIIKIGFNTLRGDILSASKYGIWEYQFEGNPHGFWEVMDGQPETKEELIILSDEISDSRIIYSSSSPTYPFSPTRNLNRSLWKSSSFLQRQVASLFYLGEERFFAETEKYCKKYNPSTRKGNASPPSNLLSLWLIARLTVRIIGEIFFRVFWLDGWFLMFDLAPNGSTPYKDYKKMIPRKSLFWADPHIIHINGKYYIFIEEYFRKKNKGHISVIEMDEFGDWKAPVKVLEKEYHLSYPDVFKVDDKYYMVPESRANKTIDLYECLEFPHKWEFKQCLMENVLAVDTTLLHYDNKWWLFTGMAENEAAAPNVALFLYYTNDLFSGKWKAHPQNPIISDVKNARPAGSIFTKDGKLFRPSQDCSKGYGYGFDLNEIETLSETEYCERKKISVRPDWDKKIRATHTYANYGDLTVIDAFKWIMKFG